MRWQNWFVLLGVSFLLHLAVFWPAPDIRSENTARPAISARIVSSASTSEAPAVPAVDDVKERGLESSQMPKQISGVGVARTDKRGVTGPAARLARVVESESLPGKFEVAGENGSGLPVATGQSVRPESASSEQGAIARYRLALAAAAIRLQSDAKSEEDALRGTAVVEVSVLGANAVPRVTLARSSGVERLDMEAVTLLTRAAGVVAVAGPIADFSLRLPVVFEPTGP